jgi:hypothetical protein
LHLNLKGGNMPRTDCKWSIILLVGVLFCSLVGSTAGQEKPASPALSGSLTATATSIAAGVGWSWGKGTLTLLDGSQHDFRVSGLDVVAVGVKQASIVGQVFNLKEVKDFEGTYSVAKAGIAVGAGAGAATMSNQNGVIINVTGTAKGIDVRLAASGMTVRLIQ